MSETLPLHKPRKLLELYVDRYRQTAPVLTANGDMTGMNVVADCYGVKPDGWRIIIVKCDDPSVKNHYAAYWRQNSDGPFFSEEEVDINKLSDLERVADLDFTFMAGRNYIGGVAAKDGRMMLNINRERSLVCRLSPALSKYWLQGDGTLETSCEDSPLASPVLDQTKKYAKPLIDWLLGHERLPVWVDSPAKLFEQLLGNLLDTGHESHVLASAESWLHVPLPQLHAFEATAVRLYVRMTAGPSEGQLPQFVQAQTDDILLLPMLLSDIIAKVRLCDRPNSPYSSTLED